MFTTPPQHGPAGLGFTNATTTLRAEWLNYVGGNFPLAIDGVGGGYYQLAGADLRISSSTRVFVLNFPDPSHKIELRGHVAIDVTNDANYATGQGSLAVVPASTFTGASTFANGATVNQAIVDGTAIRAFGNGVGRGIEATGGSTNAAGGYFLGGNTNGPGIEATGRGTGSGAVIAGGGGGVGLSVSAGGGNTNGINAWSTGTGYALACKAGGIVFEGSNPASNADPGGNAAHGLSFSKAWAHITTDGAGNGTVVDGKNIQSISVLAAGITITFARAISAGYCPTPSNLDGTSKNVVIDYGLSSTTLLYVKIFASGFAVNPATTAVRISVDVKGRQ